MLYVSESAFFQDEHNLPPSPLGSNSSGWPSLINMQSTVSLLSSYTPQSSSQQQQQQQQHPEEKGCLTVLSPINDVDECFKAPMDVDFNDTDDSWLNQPFKQQLAAAATETAATTAAAAATETAAATAPVMRSPNSDEHQSKSK
ncbi:hypothetical protein GGI23_004612 [Coemansia sp. RSA 2559]|nr:hypothetical protein GGI23_004612 [Coemansia sp. RSA 2559]